MNRNLPFSVWLLSGFILAAVPAGAVTTPSGNPYHCISERNIFGLRPPAPAHGEQPSTPLPKILLTGITTILGDKRALLKVQVPNQPFQPAKEQSYILAEGQRDGAIEVLAINEKASSVKVNNSGTVMEITFAKPSPAPAPTAPAVAPRPAWPRLPIQTVAR